MGINIPRSRVLVTRVKLGRSHDNRHPPYLCWVGNRIDVQVSSVGDATNLAGGIFIMTLFLGPDCQVYALAQGSIVTGGFSVSGASGNSVTKSHPTAGLIGKGPLRPIWKSTRNSRKWRACR